MKLRWRDTLEDMRMRSLLVMTSIFSLGVTASAQNVVKTIEAQQKAFADAVITNNFAAVENFLAPDYALIDMQGTNVSRAIYIQTLKQKAPKIAMKSFRSRIVKLTPRGKDFVVISDMDATFGMQSTGIRKSHSTLRTHQRVEETWTVHKGRWQMRRTRVIKLPSAMGIPS